MIWFTSDTHFGHVNILKSCGRPWDNIHAMGRDIVAGINERVMPEDTLYVLGDFSFRMRADEARRVRKAINCRDVRLVPGNHDRDWTQPDVADTFAVEPLIAVSQPVGNRKIVMCHYPIVDWPGLRHGAIHLHGHIHAPAAYNEWNRSEGILRYDVGVDANGYAPVSLDEILAFFDGVRHRPRVTREQWTALAHAGSHAGEAERPVTCDACGADATTGPIVGPTVGPTVRPTAGPTA